MSVNEYSEETKLLKSLTEKSNPLPSQPIGNQEMNLIQKLKKQSCLKDLFLRMFATGAPL